ncbi:site-2 protease family protein [Planctomycetota bacterium]
MSETEELKESSSEKKQKRGLVGYSRLILLLIIVAAIVYGVAQNFSFFANVLLAFIGLGMMVLIHEFGHFILAKLMDIKVEAFSICFPPTLAGIRRTEEGYRVRILPHFFPSKKEVSNEEVEEKEEWNEGRLSFCFGKKGKSGETEYRLGLIPFGGFVKMLGQEDVGEVKTTDDPRSYSNKPVGARIPVIAAGVVFNAISAALIFMLVFLIGLEQPPAVIGEVRADSPAAKAGLSSGDEIIEIAGKSDNLDFSDIAMAAALSGKEEAVPMKVRHEDGSIEDYSIVAEKIKGEMDDLKIFGISPVVTSTIADVSDSDALFNKTGLRPGDTIKYVNGKEIHSHRELMEEIKEALAPTVKLGAERILSSGETKSFEMEIGLGWLFAKWKSDTEYDLNNIYSMVPRLRITAVLSKQSKDSDGPTLQKGDIIVGIGDVDNPTYKQMREVTERYKDKELSVQVLRHNPNGSEQSLTVTVTPKLQKTFKGKEVLIGFSPELDMENSVVARTIDTEGGALKLDIPPGARITAVDGVTVSSFYDIVNEIRKYPNERITIDYRVDDKTAGGVAFEVRDARKFITLQSRLAETIPFKMLTRLYKASGPIDAIGMGFKKTVQFIKHAYLTLKRFVSLQVSPKSFRGPIGIIELSYQVVSQSSLISYFYVLGLISIFIAVFNFLPFLPFDGGHIIFLIVEKFKGSPVSQRVQERIASAGWILVGALAIYLTYQDILRIAKGVF